MRAAESRTCNWNLGTRGSLQRSAISCQEDHTNTLFDLRPPLVFLLSLTCVFSTRSWTLAPLKELQKRCVLEEGGLVKADPRKGINLVSAVVPLCPAWLHGAVSPYEGWRRLAR